MTNLLSKTFGPRWKMMQTSCCTFQTNFLKDASPTETISGTWWTRYTGSMSLTWLNMQTNKEPMQTHKNRLTKWLKSAKPGGRSWMQHLSFHVSKLACLTLFRTSRQDNSLAQKVGDVSSSGTKTPKNRHICITDGVSKAIVAKIPARRGQIRTDRGIGGTILEAINEFWPRIRCTNAQLHLKRGRPLGKWTVLILVDDSVFEKSETDLTLFVAAWGAQLAGRRHVLAYTAQKDTGIVAARSRSKKQVTHTTQQQRKKRRVLNYKLFHT